MDGYSRFQIKDYKHWSLYLHDNQGYLGRCYLWCKREDALDLPDATLEEREELFEILIEIENVFTELFGVDLFNYSFLGNATHHLHCHIVPRYSKPVAFEGLTFTDSLWGKNFLTDPNFNKSEELLQKIKNRIIEEINK